MENLPTHKVFEKNNPRIMNAWSFYDWANSVYSLVITTTIFPIYFSEITTSGYSKRLVQATGKIVEEPIRIPIKFLGETYHPDTIYGFSLTLAFIIVFFLSPILSSLADTIGNKKSFMQFFCYMGSISCMGLAMFTNMHNVYLGLMFSITASVGFWGSLVFYNSFLPDIATVDKQDRLSAKGFVTGYIGSIILVLLCLYLIKGLAKTQEETLLYTRFSFLLTGAWWFGFSQYTFRYLPQFGIVKGQLPKDLVLLNYKNIFHDHERNGGLGKVISANISFYRDVTREAFKELGKTARKLFKNPLQKSFLTGFFLYSIGMQTIFLMAPLFGKNEINLDTGKLIITLLVIQVVAIGGALFFSNLSKKIGNPNVININIILWIGACVGAYFLDRNDPLVEYKFFGIAGVIGLVMGGLQSMSRSTYSKILPKDSNENTTYFSFYDVLEKLSIILGTSIFSLIIERFRDMRIAALSMVIFFILGFICIHKLKKKMKTHLEN